MKEDRFTNTPEDAAQYEDMRAETDAAADRPTLAELQHDEAVSDCTCYWTDPSTWFYHYGIPEPGSQMEWNPDCPIHIPWVAS